MEEKKEKKPVYVVIEKALTEFNKDRVAGFIEELDEVYGKYFVKTHFKNKDGVHVYHTRSCILKVVSLHPLKDFTKSFLI